jgi:hypothetical protein
MHLGGSIESKHGIDEPRYEYSEADRPGRRPKEWSHSLSFVEVAAAFLLPISSLGFAIWRFGRGDIGPAFANLLLGAVGFVVGIVVLTAVFSSHSPAGSPPSHICSLGM